MKINYKQRSLAPKQIRSKLLTIAACCSVVIFGTHLVTMYPTNCTIGIAIGLAAFAIIIIIINKVWELVTHHKQV